MILSSLFQPSFDDSYTENENPDVDRSSMTSPPRKTPRRGARVSGKRPATQSRQVHFF